MYKKGFVSSYFLYILIIFFILLSIFFIKLQLKIKTIYNIGIANEYLIQEIVVLDFIKCKLLNNDFELGVYSVSNIHFNAEKKEDIIYVEIFSEREENLIIYLSNNNDYYEIKDYHSSTYESLDLKSLTNLSNSLK